MLIFSPFWEATHRFVIKFYQQLVIKFINNFRDKILSRNCDKFYQQFEKIEFYHYFVKHSISNFTNHCYITTHLCFSHLICSQVFFFFFRFLLVIFLANVHTITHWASHFHYPSYAIKLIWTWSPGNNLLTYSSIQPRLENHGKFGRVFHWSLNCCDFISEFHFFHRIWEIRSVEFEQLHSTNTANAIKLYRGSA